MKTFAGRWQVLGALSCMSLAIAASGCALMSDGSDSSGSSDSQSDYEVAASVASEAISARLVEEGVDATVASQLTQAGEDAAISASENTESARFASRVRGSQGASSAMTIPELLGEYSGALAAALPLVEDLLPADFDTSAVLAAAAEELAALEGNETITGLLDGTEGAGAIASATYSGMLNSITVLAVIPTANLAAFASTASEAIMNGLAKAGITDSTQLETALGSVTAAASAVFGANITDATVLSDVSKKLGEGLTLGIQKNVVFSATIDLDAAMEAISTYGMAGLAAAGVSSSQIGTLAGSLIAGMTSGAISGAAAMTSAGATPVFSLSQVNTALGSCGTILSGAIMAASTAAGVDLSGLSSIGTAVASTLGSVVLSFSSLGGTINVSGGCTVSLSGGSGSVSLGGGGGSACTPASTSFAGTSTSVTASTFSENLDGFSAVAAVQKFVASGSSPNVGAISLYGAVTAGSPTLSIYLLSESDFTSLTGSGLPSSKLVATVSPSGLTAAWSSPLVFSSSVPLTSGSNYFLVIKVAGGGFSLFRRMPTDGMSDGASTFVGGFGMKFSSTGTQTVIGSPTRGDDFDVRLFGCQ